MNSCSDGFEVLWVDKSLAVGAMPCKDEHLRLLRECGVGAVLNLCAEYCDLSDIEKTHGFQVHFLPIDDHDVPDPDRLEQALDWIEERLDAGAKVYIHCRFGMGRTGTVLYCLLLRRGLSQADVDRLCKGKPARPMNEPQWRFVSDFMARHGLSCPQGEGLLARLARLVFRKSGRPPGREA